MSSNDLIILDHLLEDQRNKLASHMSKSDFFELFVAEQILKNYDLSYDEIEEGIVGRGNDGGIDALYSFVNGQLVTDDTDFSSLRRSVIIELIIIQSKTSASFTERAIHTLISTTKDLLDLSSDLDKLATIYDSKLVNTISNFRSTYRGLLSVFPELRIAYYYGSRGDEIHPNVQARVSRLRETVNQIFSDAHFSFQFVGARDLRLLARRKPVEPIQLKVTETPISTGQIASICLVNLKDYYSFMTDENGELRRQIFEANVRDYQGAVDVNKAILGSLQENDPKEEFWWLNNGITIVASEAPLTGKTLTIQNAQVVNGLQTSMEIFNYFRKQPDLLMTNEQRSVLVRVIVPPDENSKNKIIRATNNQTNIPSPSLRATDDIQKDIEQFFETRGLFYDRRKNYYKNLGHPKEKITSIPELTQSVIACVLLEPSVAIGHSASFIKDERNYQRAFNVDNPLQAYYNCAKILKKVVTFLRSDEAPRYILGNENNAKFHLAMCIAIRQLKKIDLTFNDIAQVDVGLADNEFMIDCLDVIWEVFNDLNEAEGIPIRSLARSRTMDIALQERLHSDFNEDDVFTVPFSEWEKRMAKFIEEHGHSSVSRRNPETLQLARWASNIRSKNRKGLLSGEMYERLDQMGFDWDPVRTRWETHFQNLIDFKRKFGHCNVPRTDPEYATLGHWVNNTRQRRDHLPPERISQLEAIGFEWNPSQEEIFEERIQQLLEFEKKYGHLNVPQISPVFNNLGRWLNDQRTNRTKGKLSQERIDRLNEIGIIWNVLEHQFDEKVAQLQEFFREQGHFRVPSNYKENTRLGWWAARLRRKKPSSPERVNKLEEIGYIWENERSKPKK